MKIPYHEAFEIYTDLKLGSILKNGGNKSEQYFTAVNCILTENGIKIQPQPTEKEAKTHWQNEKNKLLKAFQRFSQSVTKKKKKGMTYMTLKTTNF